MSTKRMFLSLVPWIVFGVIVHTFGRSSAALSAAAALLVALLLLVVNRRDGVKIVDVTGVVTFAVMTAAAALGGVAAAQIVADLGRGLSALTLAAVMLVSAVTMPFTEQYARAFVPVRYWASAEFRRINRRISAMWGGIIAAVACGHLLYGYLAMQSPDGPARPANLLLNWAIPIAGVYFGARLTAKMAPAPADEAHQSADAGAHQASSQ